jgi:hypothetical protein
MAALDEKSRRRFAGLWAAQLGWGGIQRIVSITGLSRPTIARGQREVEREGEKPTRRVRRRGGGRQRVEKNGPALWPRWTSLCVMPPLAIPWGS